MLSEAVLFLGRLHVVVLHIPIGILIALGLLELHARWRRLASPPVTWSLALLGCVSAVLTATLGLLHSWSGSYDPELLFRHKWLGVLVAVSSVVVFALKATGASRRRYGWSLALCLTALLLGGHQGGSLTHGSDYLFRSSSPPKVVDISPATGIFETHCFECHGSSKQENGLRLDDRGAFLAGGESGKPAVVPGNAMASELVRRMTLTRDDDDAMPPDGRPRLTADGMLVVIDWINAGAPVERVIETEAAPDGVVEELVAAGIEIVPLSESENLLRASLEFTGERAGAEPLLQVERVATQVTWLNLRMRSLTEAEWAALGSFANLTRLHLEQTNVEDRHLEALRGAVHLRYVNLYGTDVGDDGPAHLSSLPALEDIYVWQSQVTDAGVARFLA